MRAILYFMLLFQKRDTAFIYTKPFHKIYYLNYETKPMEALDMSGDFMYYDEIYFYDIRYKLISKRENDSLVKQGFAPVHAINENRAYKKYVNGIYKPYN
jgi:hypothetical protein